MNRLPMGMAISSQILQRLMTQALATMEGRALAFQDDVCVFGKTFEEFLGNLEEFLEVSRLYNLQFSKGKLRVGASAS